MTVEVIKDTEKITIMPCGRVDTITAPDFENAIKANSGENESIVFDMIKLEYISSAGLRVILAAQKQFKSRLKLVNVAEPIMEIFEITGFVDILTIE